MALALAVAVSPALAAEHSRSTAPPTEQQRTEPQRTEPQRTEPPAPLAMPPVRDVLQGLKHLRLHPGQDALDAAETARKRPEPPAD